MESRKETDLFRIEWCDRPIVRVLGTVMTRDDALGGWVPYLNGGQSKVGIHKSVDGRRYRIYGWRINDKKVTLDCFIQRNMVFHETIGTFHHWKVGEKKMGLTFYTPAEARSFNRGVRVALEQLARAECSSSSASSTCSRLSDDRQSSCTSPASSTGSSSPCEIGALSNQKVSQDGRKKISTSSASSASSRHESRHRISPVVKRDKSSRIALNSTSSGPSTQAKVKNRQGHAHHAAVPSVVTAAPTLSLLSTTSPRFCDTPSSCDLGQPHFRWPLPQQQSYSTNLTFLNRPIAKEGSPYELSALALPSPHSASSTMCREADSKGVSKPQNQPFGNEEPEREGPLKIYDSSSATRPARIAPTHPRESTRSRGRENRRISPNHNRQRGHHHSTRPRHTKTPHLDILEKQRDLKPTEPNSYVLFSSSKPATALGSQRLGGSSLTSGMATTLGSVRACAEFKALGQMTVIDGYQYHPIISTMCNNTQYQHPQTGTLSIMATTRDASLFYNRADMYYTSNIDSIKDEAIFYEPGSSLISSPKKSKHKGECCSDSMSDIERQSHSDRSICCCPCLKSFRSRRQSASLGRYKEDLAERSKCRYCHEMFNHERNRPGSCRDAPDKCLDTINKVTCMFCVNSLFYHCCRDDEGDYDDEPCSCSNGRGGGRSKLLRRWSALTALSIIFPCLCLYPPLRACHSCGMACHCCGGKHQAHSSSAKSTSKQKQSLR